MPPMRTRFAPSPTGALHVGGVRTALFSQLMARQSGGAFVLRIEDTDRKRSEERFTEGILEGLKWLALDWDEGPFLQSERTALYATAIEKLTTGGAAYPCTCTPEELQQHREEAKAAGKRASYNRHCRPGVGPGPVEGRPASLRVASPLEGEVAFDDEIKGRIAFAAEEIEDFVIARSDGSPTYQLVVAVDDTDMGITHVVRGDDHVNNTPKQILIYRALGLEPPKFAHLPLVLGADKARLSKRHGAAAVLEYRELGYYPDALVNFLARLGWSHGDQEIFTREELVEKFAIDDVGAAAGVFNAEKLDWLNAQYLRARTPAELAADLREFASAQGQTLRGDEAWQARMVETLRERVQTLKELLESSRYYLEEALVFDDAAVAKLLVPDAAPLLEELITRLEALSSWDVPGLEESFRTVAEKQGQKLGKLAQPVRVAVTGGKKSPGIFDVLDVVGRDWTLTRLRKGVDMCRSGAPEA
ncbi:MAG: glutamate--tRNA ligase [Candidatus Binatia bacterium]|nr:glutamate--tRNA ligase [Candidatus Binatia bacterium]